MAQNRNVVFVILFGAALTITVCIVALYFLFLFYFSGEDMAFGEAIAVVTIQG